MDSFVPVQLVDQRMGEFSKEVPSVEEVDDFYSTRNIVVPNDRPYSWSNTISSLDGVVTATQGSDGVKLVGLKNLACAKAKTDFRLLAAGWAYSDAIVFSAASFRAEPEQQLLIPFADLIHFRTSVLKKSTEQPDIVMVTASGWIDIHHPAWKPDRKKLVATSLDGISKLYSTIEEQLSNSSSGPAFSVNAWIQENQITIKSFKGIDSSDVDLLALTQFLKSDWNVDYLDVSAGPTLISLMVKAKILDEYRSTTSGIVAGKRSKMEQGAELPDERPETWPALLNVYPFQQTPILEFVGIRVFGPFHIYHRGRWVYRH